MEKCWFVLRQQHYPPPKGDSGPIRLGSIIPSLRKIDSVVNKDGPEPLPPNVQVYTTRKNDFKWDSGKGREYRVDNDVGLPVGMVPGITVGGASGAAFQRSVSNYAEFDLEAQFIQPTEGYLRDSVDDEHVQRYIQRETKFLNRWSLFMITGLLIARGARGNHEETKETSFHGGPTVTLTGIVDINNDDTVSNTRKTSTSYGGSDDFIWAVRIAKLSKKLFSDYIDHETCTKGATFSTDGEQTSIRDMINLSGVVDTKFNLLYDECDGNKEAFVMAEGV